MSRDLYDVAREVCHAEGIPWTDPRTGTVYPPPAPRAAPVAADMTIPGDVRPAAVCPKCGWRCSAGGKFRSQQPCPTVGCAGLIVLDLAACALLLVRSFWPDVTWEWQNALLLVGKLSNGQVHRDFDLTSFLHVREAEAVAIERGLERLYGRFLYEELDQSPHGDAGVTWARAPLDARIRSLARAHMTRWLAPNWREGDPND